MRKSIATLLVTIMTTAMLVGCGGTSGAKGITSASQGEKSYTVGIAQFAVHGSLDNCREGFLEGLAEEGIKEGENLTVYYENANADGATGTQIINNFQSKKTPGSCHNYMPD